MDEETKLSRQEARLLREVQVPEQMFLAPPAPVWPQDCHAWRAVATGRLEPPDLVDSAPEGTDVTEHDPRLLWHGHMRTVVTPQIARALLVVAEQIRANRQRTHGRVGIILDGPRGTGKSTLLQTVGVYWERRLQELYAPDENRIPVVSLSVPPPMRGNLRNWPGAFARYLGQERESGDPTESIIRAMRNARTLLVLIDGIERLRTAADAQLTFEYLDMISEETGATFIYCGRHAHNIVDPLTRDNDTQLEPDEVLRGDHTVLLTSRMGFDDDGAKEFLKVVDLFDADLRLYRHQRGDLLDLADYLHTRSRGYLRALSQLICQAAQKAILSKKECITRELLEEVSLGRLVRL